MYNNNQLGSWNTFLTTLEQHFKPSQFKDPSGALFKLNQIGSVKDYQMEFEAYFERKYLYYKIIVWIVHFKIKVFMSVIKEKYY